MKQSPGFDRKDYPLKQFRHEVWKGFVLVNLDGQAESLASQYAALDPIVDVYDLENYQTVEQTDWECASGTGRSWWTTSWSATTTWARTPRITRGPVPGFPSYTGEVGDYFTTMWSGQAPGYPAEPPFLASGRPNAES